MIYTGKKGLRQQQEDRAAKKTQIDQNNEKQAQELQKIYKKFQENLLQFAGKYKEQINKDPDFREKFNDLCEQMDVNPMVSRKTIWTDLGFGDFYNELAMTIVDICNKKKYVTGGIMKFGDIQSEYQHTYKKQISKKDIKRALKTIDCLGGVQVSNEYVSIVPMELAGDTTSLLEAAEEYGFVSLNIMQNKKGWTQDRYESSVGKLKQEGLVWVDKKTASSDHHIYFPSQLTNLIEFKSQFKKV